MFEYRQVLTRMRLGDTDRAIARAGLMGRRKAAELRQVAEAAGWLDPATALPEDAQLSCRLSPRTERASSVSLAEPHRKRITEWWDRGVQGTTIHAALVRRHGFQGSYSSVRRFLQGIEAARPRATTVLEFDPGEAAQVDFGKGPDIVDTHSGELISTWVFVMTLAWSRHAYAEIVTDQKVATWLGCHRRAFEWFGGVVTRVIIDNPKCAITRACYHDPDVQRSYAECAEGYGFKIDPCPPRDPKKKGRVESGVKYVKRAFVPLREFRDLADANAQLWAWLMSEAGNRIHGTTYERPLTRFAETEREFLHALPARAPELATWKKVKLHPDCHVQFEKAYYSAPWRLVRQALWLRATETTVQLYRDHELVAAHPHLYRPGSRATIEDHLPPEHLAYKRRDPQWCLAQAKRVGSSCHALVERLFAHKVLENLRAAQSVCALARRFGDRRLDAACQRALAFDDPRYRTVKTILDNGIDLEPRREQAFDRLAASYTGSGRFSRDTSKLLTH
jgi:transposase